MGETTEDITVNDDSDTLSLREFIRRHSDHLDTGIHGLQQTVERLEKMVTEMHAELDAARPLIERWQHSRINQLLGGRMPWTQSATGGNHDHAT